MTAVLSDRIADEVESRARLTLGSSDEAIYAAVAKLLKNTQGGVLVDVGCGSGHLWKHVGHLFEKYIGIDAHRYQGFPEVGEFHRADLDTGRVGLRDECADVVAAVEIIEHLENPRAFMRELTRLAKPGGLVIVTTPNQLSLLSLVTLIVKKRFNAFQDVHYPAHLTALLEVDLERIAGECGLEGAFIEYTLSGRVPMTSRHFPQFIARRFPRALSDNLLLIGRNPAR